jgi:hypothetical protein
MNNITFENPQEFFQHLQSSLADLANMSEQNKDNLLHGSMHALSYLLESQNHLSAIIYQVMDSLSKDQPSWGHRLAEVYTVLNAGQITPEEMNQLLKEEVCGSSSTDQS